MPSLGGSRRTAGGSAGRSRSAGGGRRGTATGAGRFGGRGGARRAASYTTGTGRGAGSAAARKSAARYRRGAASAMDRVAAGARRGRAAARAARQAAKGGGGPRAASREARKALSDAHRTVPVRGAWRRTLGSAAWGAGGMCIGLLYAAGRLARQALRHLTRIQYRSDAPGAGRPRIGTTVNRPASAAGSSEGKRGAAMTVPGFVQAAEDLGEALAKYEPPPGPGGMVEMAEHLRMLPDALLQVSQGFSTFAKHCREEWPMHPAIAEFVHDLAKIQAHMAGVASEIRPAMERLHEHDFDRSRNPRPSEDRWNVA